MQSGLSFRVFGNNDPDKPCAGCLWFVTGWSRSFVWAASSVSWLQAALRQQRQGWQTRPLGSSTLEQAPAHRLCGSSLVIYTLRTTNLLVVENNNTVLLRLKQSCKIFSLSSA